MPRKTALSTDSIRQYYKRVPFLISLVKYVRSFFHNLANKPVRNQLLELNNLVLFDQTKKLQSVHPNPLNKFGKKCFSQTDEDGITLEILRRIKQITNGVYAEFGVGDGTENNTLILAALGWKGFWVGGEKLIVNVDSTKCKKFAYLREWLSLIHISEPTRPY